MDSYSARRTDALEHASNVPRDVKHTM